MASLEKAKNPTENELKLAKMEGDFYKTCNAVRREGIEFENVRNFLLRELLEIEEKKTSQLKQEVQEIQLAWQKDRETIIRLKQELKDATIGRTLSYSTPTRSAKLNALAILQESQAKRLLKPPKAGLSKAGLSKAGLSKGVNDPVSSGRVTLSTSTDSPTDNSAVADDSPAMVNDDVVDNDPLSADSTDNHVISNNANDDSVPAVVTSGNVCGSAKPDESAKNLQSKKTIPGTTSALPSKDMRIEEESLVVRIDLTALGSGHVPSELKVQDVDVAPKKRGRPSKKVESTTSSGDDYGLQQGDAELESQSVHTKPNASECEEVAPQSVGTVPKKGGRPLKRLRGNNLVPKDSESHSSEEDPVTSNSIPQAVLELDSRRVDVLPRASHADNTIVMPLTADQNVDNDRGQSPLMTASHDGYSDTVSLLGPSGPLDPKPSEVGHVITKPTEEMALKSPAIVPRKKGRPPKKQTQANVSDPVLDEADSESTPVPSEVNHKAPDSKPLGPGQGVSASGIVPKKRPGRPPKKHKDPLTDALVSKSSNTDETMASRAPKKRGRPRKQNTTDIHVVKSPNSEGECVMAKSSEADPVPLKPEAVHMAAPDVSVISKSLIGSHPSEVDHMTGNAIAAPTAPRKRGRPRKQLDNRGTSAAKGLSSDPGRHPDIPAVGHVIPKSLEAAGLPPKKRGRPPKRPRINSSSEMAPVDVNSITDDLIPPAKKMREALGDAGLVQSLSGTHREQSTAPPTAPPTALGEPPAVVSEDHTSKEEGVVVVDVSGGVGMVQNVQGPGAPGVDSAAGEGSGKGCVVQGADSAGEGVVDGGVGEMDVGEGVVQSVDGEGVVDGGEGEMEGVVQCVDGGEGVNSSVIRDAIEGAVEGDDTLLEGHKDGATPIDTVKPAAASKRIVNDVPDGIVDNKTSSKSNLKLKTQKASTSHSAPPPPLKSTSHNAPQKSTSHTSHSASLKSTDVPRRGRPPKQKDAVPLVGAKKGSQLKRTGRNPENSLALPFYGGSLRSDNVQQQCAAVVEEGKPLPTTARPSLDAEEDTPVLSPPPLPLGRPRREQATRRQAQAQPQEQDRREISPEIPLQDTNLTLSLPMPSSRKVKKRKTLESVLSTLLESKLSRNGEVSPSERRENSRAVQNVVEKGQQLAEDLKKAVRKRKTLAKREAKGRRELSVVDQERHVERNSTIRMNTSTLVAPKLKSNPVL